MSFTAQELAHRITIGRLEEYEDPETGYRVEEWREIAAAFARVDPMLGRERLAAMQVVAVERTKFTTRYLPGITTYDRLLWDGSEWNIQSIVNVGGRNRETLIYATRT